MKTMFKLLICTSALAGLAACGTTSGMGEASTPSGDLHATLSWTSTGGHAGQMTAQLSNGESFGGKYFQISHDTQVTDLDPLWAGWGRPHFYAGWGGGWGRGRGWGGGWGGWGYWGPRTDFVTTYSGRVVANLAGANGTHMRCQFNLRNPSYGMPGGGEGQCQLPSGQTIDATFDRTS